MKNPVDFTVTQVSPGSTRVVPLTDEAREWLRDRAASDYASSIDLFTPRQVDVLVTEIVDGGFSVANSKQGVH